MPDKKKILVTGGNGLLGSEFKKIRPEADYTDIEDFNILDYEQMQQYVRDKGYDVIVHAAAFTSPPRIDKDPPAAIETNIIGTANVVKLCIAFGIKLLYISTDYVFRGDAGGYRESDPVYPVNKYAWSKLGGECAVRLYDNSLIVRTTFAPNVFPYEKAFTDQWTSRESVSTIARMISTLFDIDATGTVHVGGPRKSVYEFAKSLDPDKEIGELSIHDVDFAVPVDTSLNCERYHELVQD